MALSVDGGFKWWNDDERAALSISESLRSGCGLFFVGRVWDLEPPLASNSRSFELRHFILRFWNQIFTYQKINKQTKFYKYWMGKRSTPTQALEIRKTGFPILGIYLIRYGLKNDKRRIGISEKSPGKQIRLAALLTLTIKPPSPARLVCVWVDMMTYIRHRTPPGPLTGRYSHRRRDSYCQFR